MMVLKVTPTIIFFFLCVRVSKAIHILQTSDKTYEEYSDTRSNHIGRKLLAGSSPKCSVTTGEHKFPWWRVELTDEAVVNKIVILTGTEEIASQLHDLAIRVGNKDIAEISGDNVFGENALCDEMESIPSTTRIEINCNSTTVGKFVSLQITEPCNFPGCFQKEENVLTLCEVQVYGVKIKQLISEGKASWVDHQTVQQSSVAFDGKAKSIKFAYAYNLFSYDSSNLCFYSLRVDGNVSYEALLQDAYVINDIKMKQKANTPEESPYKIQVFTTKDTSPSHYELCGKFEGHLEADNMTTITCRQPRIGRRVAITVESSTIASNDILGNCDIEIWANKAINVAKYKPTALSSSAGQKEDSSFAVDGNLHSRTFIYDGGERFKNVQTAADDPFPWWKVDLLTSHLVKKIFIFRTSTDLIHNIVIRVGSQDVPKIFLSRIFTHNPICQDLSNHSLSDQPVRVVCRSPSFGRYVTIQVVKFCKNSSTCEENPLKNKLAFSEVEIYGIPVDVYYFGNLALSRRVIKSQDKQNVDGQIKSLGVNAITYNWWKFESEEAIVVDEINIYIKKGFDQRASFRIQIWVDSIDVASNASTEWINPNQLCYENDSIRFTKDFYIFSCNRKVGKFVFMQYVRLSEKSNSPFQDLFFTDVSVWGYKIRTKYLLAGGKIINSNWREDADSIAAEQHSRVRNVEYNGVQCTYTVPGFDPYPWWRIKFPKAYKISRVLIKTTNDEYHYRLHDAEIRVGFEDIAEAPSAQPFTGNALCNYTGRHPLPKHRTLIDCYQPVIGNYLSIQLVKPCSVPRECNVVEPNILHLCGVGAYGSAITNINSTDVNIAEGGSARQSTTLERAEASLSLDGNY